MAFSHCAVAVLLLSQVLLSTRATVPRLHRGTLLDRRFASSDSFEPWSERQIIIDTGLPYRDYDGNIVHRPLSTAAVVSLSVAAVIAAILLGICFWLLWRGW